MGNRANPIGILSSLYNGNRKYMSALWCASGKNFSKFLRQDYIIREVIKAEKDMRFIISKVEINRTGIAKVIVTIYTSRPGVIIGKNCENLNKIKEKMVKRLTSLNLNPTDLVLNVAEVVNSEKDATLLCLGIVKQLEDRANYLNFVRRSITALSKMHGVLGVRILLSGRINGVAISREENYFSKAVPLSSYDINLSYGQDVAYTVSGTVGVKVYINLEGGSHV